MKNVTMKWIFTLLASILIPSAAMKAQSNGPNSPTVYSTFDTGSSFSNLGGVQAVDNNPAYSDLAQYPTCNSFMCYYSNIASFTGFGFSIPSGATITGIKIDAMQRVSSPGGGIHDSLVILALNGNSLGTDHADPSYWLDAPTMNSYGDSTDNWGYAWTPAEINDLNFGLQYRVTNDSYDQPASLDYLAMTVYYQTGTGIISQTSAPWDIAFIGNSLNISASGSVLAKGFRVDVLNVEGKLQYSQSLFEGQSKLNLKVDASSWNEGVFIVQITSNEGASIQRKVMLIK